MSEVLGVIWLGGSWKVVQRLGVFLVERGGILHSTVFKLSL